MAGANGFFNDCVLTYREGVLTITLRYGGYDILCENRCGFKIEQLIAEEFSLPVSVAFDGCLSLKRKAPTIRKYREDMHSSATDAVQREAPLKKEARNEGAAGKVPACLPYCLGR